MKRVKENIKIKLLILLCLVAITITGCTNKFDAMPNLTDEESQIIAEYVAGILIKHDKNNGKLVDDYVIAKYDETQAQKKANLEALMATKEQYSSEEEANPGENGDSSDYAQEQEQVPVFYSIDEACNLDGFKIVSNGYEVLDSYPDISAVDAYFSMDATEGNKLLVLYFIVMNETESEKPLDMIHKDVKFKIGVNGSDSKNSLTTILDDDLSSYNSIVPAGGSTELVLVREVGNETANSISSVELKVVTEDGVFDIQ